VPGAVSMHSIARADAPADALAGPLPRAESPTTRPSIPPREFFAPPEPMVDENDVESETNPLFGGLLARSVAPTSMDAPSPAARAAEARSVALGRRVAAVALAFVLGAGGAAIARSATLQHRAPVLATTPLPADVLAAVAAIKLPPPPPPAPLCPSGMVRVPGATVSLPGKAPREVTVAPYCIGALEVTVDQLTSCTDTTCKHAVTSSTTNAWSGISWWEHRTLDPQCNARDSTPGRSPAWSTPDARAKARRPMNCIDEKTAAAYCEARGARLPTEAEWALAAQSAGADGKSLLELLPSGVDDTRWEWTSDGPHGGGAQPPARWHGTNVRSHTLGFRCAEGSR